MPEFGAIVTICAGISTIASAAALIKAFGQKHLDANEGIKCLLRSEMLRVYYENKTSKSLAYYERENFDHLYQAYKVRGGNSFIDDIYSTIRTWEVTKDD